MKIRTLIIAKRKISKIGTYGQNEDKDSYNCKKKDRHIWKYMPSKTKISLFIKSLNYFPLSIFQEREINLISSYNITSSNLMWQKVKKSYIVLFMWKYFVGIFFNEKVSSFNSDITLACSNKTDIQVKESPHFIM